MQLLKVLQCVFNVPPCQISSSHTEEIYLSRNTEILYQHVSDI